VKTAVIIGASSGLGAYLADGLAGTDYRVIAVARSFRGRPESGGQLTQVSADVRQENWTRILTDALAGDLPDVIVYCAVDYGDPASAPTSESLQAMFQTNAIAPYLYVSDVLKDRDNARPLCCVIVNSDTMFHISAQNHGYAASKAALKILTSALASLCRGRPHSVATIVLGPIDDDRKAAEIARVVERRGLDHDEVVRQLLRRSNPAYAIDHFIDASVALRLVQLLTVLGRDANGAVCRIDGGSAGPLI